MSEVYEFDDYDKYLSLKPGYGLWLVILYFMHPYILLISTRSFGRGGKKEGLSLLKDMIYPDDFSLVLALLVTLPTLCFMYAWAKRKPNAPDSVRYIWKNGATILSISALLNIVVAFVPFIIGVSHTVFMVAWAQAGLSVLIIVYLQFSKRVKGTFADFPKEQQT